jgi:hypothetical protein
MPPLRVWMHPFSSRKRHSADRRGRSRRLRWMLRLGCVLGLLAAGCLGREPNQPRDPSPRSAAASQPRQPCDDAAPAGQVRLSWDRPRRNADGTALQDLAGYRLHYGRASGSYTETVDVGRDTTHTVRGLRPGATYYFAVTAYDIHGNESRLSDEVKATVPPATGRPPVLTHTPFVRGKQTRFQVSGVNPGDRVSFLFSEAGQGDGPCSPDLGGLCVDLLAPQIFGETTGGETGVATLAVAIPARAAVGTTLAIQAVVRRAGGAGCASKTNVRTVTVQ